MKIAVARWFNRFKVSNNTELDGNDKLSLPYTALSPIADASIDDYKKALDWALKNRSKNDIKNIALTGPYGSGKTSILKTYIANYKDNDLHFLHLSLATFKEEEENEAGKPQKEDILRQIELSILQQIFYHEDDSKIPDSRFRKIKNYTKRKLRLSTIVLSVFFFSLLNLIYPELLEQLLKATFPTGLQLSTPECSDRKVLCLRENW